MDSNNMQRMPGMEAQGVALKAFFWYLFAAVTYFNYPNVDPNLRPHDTPTDRLNKTYDFVIIGAGSAGCVLANRLTEIPDWSVLLLEAGKDETVLTDTPLLAITLWNTSFNWGYYTVPQKRACLANGGRCVWPRGKVIGGCSTLNYMVYSRGNKADYNHWASLGNEGWSYDEVLPYFKLSEDNHNPQSAADKTYHGTGGYLTVENPNYVTSLLDAYLQGGEEAGYPVRDCNAASQTGFMRVQSTIRNGSRCSTGKAFLRPARNRPNLNVAESTFVTKILFDGTKATGVQFERDGELHTVYARKEVILSAGSLNSAQLLMVSGVGPRQELESFNIPVIKDLSVGLNLQDHYGAPMMFKTDPSTAITSNEYMNIVSIDDYAQPDGLGPLSSTCGVEAVSWTNSPYMDPKLDHPDIEVHWTSYYPDLFNDVSLFFGLGQVTQPRSRGTVTLASADIHVPPLLNPNYFSNEHDLQVAIAAANFVTQVSLNSTLMRNELHTRFTPEYYPMCSMYPTLSQEQIKCIVESYTTTIFHPVGTSMMGPKSNPHTVVSRHLKIHGMQNIRVIDASIMPTITNGNTNVPTIMIAEKGADIIKCSYGKPAQIPQACRFVDGDRD